MAVVDHVEGFPAATASMPFIVSLNAGKADSATRKLIRSHVMRGKKRKSLRPANNEQRKTSRQAVALRNKAERVDLEAVMELYSPQIPSRVGSDVSFVDFADDIELSTLLNITKVSTVAMKIIFPLMMAIGFQVDKGEWLHLVARDAAALHIAAFAIEGFIDKVLRRQENSVNYSATLHFEKGLCLLRKRLRRGDDGISISDSTMGAVLKLASVAYFNGDSQTSRQHMNGLRKMVDLRGGLQAFRGKYLLMEMLRYDLAIALVNGANPVFYSRASESVIAYPEKLLPAAYDNVGNAEELLQNLNSDLAAAWRIMREFCLLVNLGTQTQRQIHLELIYETMTAVMNRLLRMTFNTSSIDEAVRQGLLAFSFHVFLQWQDIKPPYRQYSSAYRNCLQHLKRNDGVSPRLMLWLLTIGAISVFSLSDETWLRESLREHTARCHANAWKDIQDILKSYMWIALLDEEAGKRIHETLRS